jgi:hypothetical protein
MPRNTFGMCLGTGRVEGVVNIEGRECSVEGGGIFDHPRIVVEENIVAPFGWYLYSPVRFVDGTHLACYYSEDADGQRDSVYSAGLLTLPGRKTCWLGDCNVVNLELDTDGLPVRWETLLRSEGAQVSLRVKICQLPLRQFGQSRSWEAERKIRRISVADGSGGRSRVSRAAGPAGARPGHRGVFAEKGPSAKVSLMRQLLSNRQGREDRNHGLYS